MRSKWTRCLRAAPLGRRRADRARRAISSASRKRGGWPARSPKRVGARQERQRREMGTLGSGNHYLEVQEVAEIFDARPPRPSGCADDVVVTIHCGSRGLGHQIGTEFLQGNGGGGATASASSLPDRELACAPINSEVGQRYLGAMRAAINCALANRQILGHYARRVFAHFFPGLRPAAVCSTSRTTPARWKSTRSDGKQRELFVHRKGATRAFGPGHPSLPDGIARGRSAGVHRRQHGHGLVYSGRRGDGRGARPSPRRATAPDGRCPAMPRSSGGADARSWTSLPARAS